MASLGVEIAKLSNPIPQFLDQEDFEDSNISEKAINPEVQENFYQKSELRSRTAPLLEDIDSAYVGRKVSRKSRGLVFNETKNDLHFKRAEEEESGNISYSSFESSEDDNITDDENNENLTEEDISNFQKTLLTKCASDEEENIKEDSEGSEAEEMENDGMISQFANIDVSGEIDKGNAIKAQQEIWNKLCECRIKLQKLLIIANKLPQTENWHAMKNKGDEEIAEPVLKGNDCVKSLLNNLMKLHCELSKRNSKENEPESINEIEIPSSEDELDSQTIPEEKTNTIKKGKKRKCENEDYNEKLTKFFESEKLYRNAVIQKWDDKVRLSTGRMTQKSFSAFGNSAVKQIDQILQDKARLIRRTQLKRSVYRVLGKSEASDLQNIETSDEQKIMSKQDMLLKDYDPQIFDDDDFYRQLLKDIIQNKTFGIDPAVVRKQMELQKIRNKMKRKVDTKASKGRKLRYDIHPKLVNFMAPVETTKISDEARENLMKHLFENRIS